MGEEEEEAAALEFINRFIDKRQTGKLELKMVPKLVKFPDWMVGLVERNRIPMGMTFSAFVRYCVVKTTKPYEKKRKEWVKARADAARSGGIPNGDDTGTRPEE